MNGFKAILAENAGTGNHTATGWPGGVGYFIAEATFGGGSVKLQMQSPQGTWMDVATASVTAAGCVRVDLPPGQIRSVSATAIAVYAYCVRA